MSTVALGVAVAVGGLATTGFVAIFLIGYLFLAGVVGIATLHSVRHAVTAEVVRVIVVRRLELRRERARAHDDGERWGTEERRSRRRGTLRKALRGLTRTSA